MHEPMSAEEISSGQPLASASAADLGTDAVRAVGGVRAVDERLELVEVDLDQLVVERAVVGAQVARPRWSAASAIASRPVALRYIAMFWS